MWHINIITRSYKLNTFERPSLQGPAAAITHWAMQPMRSAQETPSKGRMMLYQLATFQIHWLEGPQLLWSQFVEWFETYWCDVCGKSIANWTIAIFSYQFWHRRVTNALFLGPDQLLSVQSQSEALEPEVRSEGHRMACSMLQIKRDLCRRLL